MKKFLLSSITVASLTLASTAQASLIMNVYDGAGQGGVAGVQTAIDTKTPTYSTVAPVIDYYDGTDSSGNYTNNYAFPGGLVNNFGVNFTGFVNVIKAGNYNFRSFSDDGAQLKIDGKVLFSDSKYHYPVYNSGSTYLSVGAHAIDFIFFENGGGATVELDVKDEFAQSYSLLGAADSLQTSTVPEPASLALFGAALAGLAAVRRRQTKV